MEAPVFSMQRTAHGMRFMSQECAGRGLTNCGPVNYKSVIWSFFIACVRLTEP
jgi:hypothetical protein